MIETVKNISPRCFRVWQRNRDVYFRTWKTNLVPPLVEPILYLLAFGLGVGALLKEVPYKGEMIGYTAFIAPGLLATQVMFMPFFENGYNTFIRMYYQKTFDAVLSTPLTVEDLMMGELVWGATKGLIACSVMMIAITGFGLLHFPTVLIIIPFSFFASFFFGSIALCFSGIVPQIDTFNLPIFLFIMPMFLFSGTFFPLDVLPSWAQTIAAFVPLTHVVQVMREAALGRLPFELLWDILYLALITPPVMYLGIRLMKRRMIK